LSSHAAADRELAIASELRAAGCVFAEEEARQLVSAAGTRPELAAMVDRRIAGLPLEQVLGWAEFCGLRLALDPGVFVPRRRTEFLVRQAARVAGPATGTGGRAGGSPVVVVDLCCGCGAVGAALAAVLPRVTLYAVDVDAAAVRCARRNLAALEAGVYQGDLFEPLPGSLRGCVDLLVANVPYVPTDGLGLLPPEARIHEPRVALDGGADGLQVVRRVGAAARAWLAPGGHLLVETSEHQASAAADFFADHGLTVRVASCEELNATVVIGAKPGEPAWR
jgi:release factor glutamine methyltransferase